MNLCMNCKFCDNFPPFLCLHPLAKQFRSPVEGDMPSCKEMRRDNRLYCGREGKWFVHIDEGVMLIQSSEYPGQSCPN